MPSVVTSASPTHATHSPSTSFTITSASAGVPTPTSAVNTPLSSDHTTAPLGIAGAVGVVFVAGLLFGLAGVGAGLGFSSNIAPNLFCSSAIVADNSASSSGLRAFGAVGADSAALASASLDILCEITALNASAAACPLLAEMSPAF